MNATATVESAELCRVQVKLGSHEAAARRRYAEWFKTLNDRFRRWTDEDR
ncbi:hypothetical protein JOF29_000022 [Kribbella aluminosa]|uniref:Uncharacterized protein n=1 Tax=Kribbella aluminosa TaxID=416017 RepID=A0ABS4UBI2_9ACTN|nr:hypothetical protein [Kribbella aluminosa]MBP2348939.1 hypothetical protein [Kribbella aluminosa]